MGRGIERKGGKGWREEDRQIGDERIYRSGSIGIDYVQYKPFIQIKL